MCLFRSFLHPLTTQSGFQTQAKKVTAVYNIYIRSISNHTAVLLYGWRCRFAHTSIPQACELCIMVYDNDHVSSDGRIFFLAAWNDHHICSTSLAVMSSCGTYMYLNGCAVLWSSNEKPRRLLRSPFWWPRTLVFPPLNNDAVSAAPPTQHLIHSFQSWKTNSKFHSYLPGYFFFTLFPAR